MDAKCLGTLDRLRVCHLFGRLAFGADVLRSGLHVLFGATAAFLTLVEWMPALGNESRVHACGDVGDDLGL